MKEITIENYKFLIEQIDDAFFVFSTAENDLNFNKALPEGIVNLEKLKTWFKLDEVGYCNQTHSDTVLVYKTKNQDGDALISISESLALGVFTADCVPVLMFDKVNKVIAAVHSGWRGTVKGIVSRTIEKMIDEFNLEPENLIVYIGPHNKQCCYEVGKEVLEEFKNCSIFNDLNYIKGNNISLKTCIEKQLEICGVNKESIHDIDLCTYCSKEYKLHSYRRGSKDYGRMFSFVFIKE
jgi:YfiH family protein